MIHSDFLGKGVKFPPQLSNGKMLYSEGEDLIKESIQVILTTVPGERLMNPEFGCMINLLPFSSNSPATRSRVAYEVEEALKKWEHRITVENVQVTVDESETNKVNIEIEYLVLERNRRDNMVFPFYLENM